MTITESMLVVISVVLLAILNVASAIAIILLAIQNIKLKVMIGRLNPESKYNACKEND